VQLIIIALLGLAAGILSALLGVGGGIIMVPVMVMLLGVAPKVAVGTSLAVIIPTALTGVLRHYSNGNVDLRMALMLAVGAVIGAYLGASLAESLPDQLVKRLFALLMIVTAVKLFTGK
jgi:uncharacterized membrane protein YfcA